MALLESKPAPDRAPDSLAAGTPQPLRGELEQLLGADRVLARASDIVRYASDASPYRLLPQVVVMARDAEDVAKTLAFGKRSGIPVTFRAGGTSLNGQGQSEGILVDVRRHFSGVAVEQAAARGRGRSRPPAPGSSPAPCSATPTACSPRTGASSAPTRPAPTSPASAA